MPFQCLRGYCELASAESGYTSFGIVGRGAGEYYRARTPFSWLVQNAYAGDPAGSRQQLTRLLRNQRYSVNVVFGIAGTWAYWSGANNLGVLEVTGYQDLDRGQVEHVAEQIRQTALQAGFELHSEPMFNLTGSPGATPQTSGSRQTWGDQTPVETKSIFSEIGVDLSGDTSFVGGSIKNLAIYAGIGLVVFALLTRK
jgi:hypothetical protein